MTNWSHNKLLIANLVVIISAVGGRVARVGQPDDTAGHDSATVAVPKTCYVATETEVILFLADTDRPTGHWVPVLDGELVPRYLVDEGHTGRIRSQVTQVTSVAVRRVYVAVSLVIRIEVWTNRSATIGQISEGVNRYSILVIRRKSCN